MTKDELKSHLEKWARIDTFHTTHPSDDKRFHEALESAFKQYGYGIGYDDAFDAIVELFRAHMPKYDKNEVERIADKKAAAIEHIAGYLDDVE